MTAQFKSKNAELFLWIHDSNKGGYNMNLILSSQLSIPAFEVMLLFFLTTCAIVSGHSKLGLLIMLCFMMHWGFMLNPDLFTNDGGLTFNSSMYAYWGFGFVILLLSIIGFFVQTD